MVLLKTSQQIIGSNITGKRVDHDFYPTPPEAVEALLKLEKFEGEIWECACGDGAISKILLQHGYKVYSSDLIDRGYGSPNHDFLTSQLKSDNIVTNPPFNLSLEFTLKALQCVKNKAVFLNKITFLEGIKRKNNLFNLNKLKKVHIFSKRLGFNNKGKKGLICFAWYVFDVNYNGKPTIDWI